MELIRGYIHNNGLTFHPLRYN